MKFFNMFLAFSLAFIMSLSSFGTIASAEESQTPALSSTSEEENVYEFDVPQDEVAQNGIMPLSTFLLEVDQTFTMNSSHRGGDRAYSGNKMQYAITITDEYGNPVDNTVSIRLYDYNHTYSLKYHNLKADGSTTVISNVSITAGRIYYFKYAVTSGASRNLKVHMRIWSY